MTTPVNTELFRDIEKVVSDAGLFCAYQDDGSLMVLDLASVETAEVAPGASKVLVETRRGDLRLSFHDGLRFIREWAAWREGRR